MSPPISGEECFHLIVKITQLSATIDEIRKTTSTPIQIE